MRFEVRTLLNGGFVIVDTTWEHPMIGPYSQTKAGREEAIARAAEFEQDPTKVPGETVREWTDRVASQREAARMRTTGERGMPR
jgi:hypothetical protein